MFIRYLLGGKINFNVLVSVRKLLLEITYQTPDCKIMHCTRVNYENLNRMISYNILRQEMKQNER